MSILLNPYAPPASPTAIASGAQAGRPPRGLVIKWIYLATIAVRFPAAALAALVADEGVKALLGMVDLFYFGTIILALVWIYQSWDEIPPALRRDTTAARAIIGLLIPLYSVYWLFAVNTTYCRILGQRLAAAGSALRAPLGLAMVGVFAYIGESILGFVEVPALKAATIGLGGLVWFLYMRKCDEERALVARAEGAAAQPNTGFAPVAA